MKKYLLFLLLSILLCSSCAINPYVLPLKTYKSESPYIYISQTSLCGGYKGEIEDDNSETIEVIVEFFHGEFYIWKYVSDDELGEELLRGDYRYSEKENILVFYCDNGDEITLIPIEEEAESSMYVSRCRFDNGLIASYTRLCLPQMTFPSQRAGTVRNAQIRVKYGQT